MYSVVYKNPFIGLVSYYSLLWRSLLCLINFLATSIKRGGLAILIEENIPSIHRDKGNLTATKPQHFYNNMYRLLCHQHTNLIWAIKRQQPNCRSFESLHTT